MAMEPITVAIKQLPHGSDLPLPAYETQEAAGMDLRAAVTAPITIAPHCWDAIPTGIAIALPSGYEAQIRPRSGLARKFGISMVNSPGTIDADYRGEIMVLLINHGPEPFVIERGDRIAQMVIAPVSRAEWNIISSTEDLESTGRGSGGFGHTGKK
jgi:dUTP pyrophosphatase